MDIKKLQEDNRKLVEDFGASDFSKTKDKPDFYTFQNNLIYSHRDFDKFYSALKKGEKCAIVSGFNASGTIHLGHKAVFDTNLYFQREFKIPVFIPISDDESYVTGKIKDQEEALKNSLSLAKELLAYGYDSHKTYFIIDQIYTNIYNLAIKLSKKVTMSEIKAVYGYKQEENPGLHFYPAVQSAHVLFPQHEFDIKNVLVPIGPDEDSHLRIARDIASRFNLQKPSVLHISFGPGIDGEKMSKSRDNAIFLKEDEKTIRKKVNKAFSGGAKSLEEQRKHGGNPDADVSIYYLERFFLTKEESLSLREKYKKGEILSSEVKKMLADQIVEFTSNFQSKLKKVKFDDLDKTILRNKDFNLKSELSKL